MLFFLFALLSRSALLDDIEFELYEATGYDRLVAVVDKKLYMMRKSEADMSKANSFFLQDGLKLRQGKGSICAWGISTQTLQICEYVPINSEFVIENTGYPGLVQLKTADGKRCAGYRNGASFKHQIELVGCNGPLVTAFRILRKSERIPYSFNVSYQSSTPIATSSYSKYSSTTVETPTMAYYGSTSRILS